MKAIQFILIAVLIMVPLLGQAIPSDLFDSGMDIHAGFTVNDLEQISTLSIKTEIVQSIEAELIMNQDSLRIEGASFGVANYKMKNFNSELLKVESLQMRGSYLVRKAMIKKRDFVYREDEWIGSLRAT